MTDTNMTDTNYHHDSNGGVPQDCGKRMRVTTTRRNDENRTSLLLVVVCGFVVCCAVSGTTPVVCCVGCVGGDSRRVTPGCPFRTRLLSLWALMVLHLGGCGRVGYCQH